LVSLDVVVNDAGLTSDDAVGRPAASRVSAGARRAAGRRHRGVRAIAALILSDARGMLPL
jgi:hypothetical protein